MVLPKWALLDKRRIYELRERIEVEMDSREAENQSSRASGTKTQMELESTTQRGSWEIKV